MTNSYSRTTEHLAVLSNQRLSVSVANKQKNSRRWTSLRQQPPRHVKETYKQKRPGRWPVGNRNGSQPLTGLGRDGHGAVRGVSVGLVQTLVRAACPADRAGAGVGAWSQAASTRREPPAFAPRPHPDGAPPSRREIPLVAFFGVCLCLPSRCRRNRRRVPALPIDHAFASSSAAFRFTPRKMDGSLYGPLVTELHLPIGNSLVALDLHHFMLI